MNRNTKVNSYGIQPLILLVLAVLTLTFSSEPVWAHRVNIFPWVDGDMVHTQSKIGGGKKVKDARVLVYDLKDNLLLEGKTDANGMFSFPIPQKTGLKVVLDASMGHRAEWKIPYDEIAQSVSQGSGPVAVESSFKDLSARNSNIQDQLTSAGSDATALQREDIRKIINDALDEKLRPIKTMLADRVDRGPGVTEIIGGIGYIFGLVGIAMFVANRHRTNNDD